MDWRWGCRECSTSCEGVAPIAERDAVRPRRNWFDAGLESLKALGAYRLLGFVYDKRRLELEFQKRWAREFKQNPAAVLEYWKTYRAFDQILARLAIRESDRVLDVGCGVSSVLHFLPGQRYGIDPLADEYRRLYDYPPELRIQKGEGEAIPFPDEHFRAVFCSNVLDHVERPEHTLAEIERVLEPSGHFVLTVEVFAAHVSRDRAHPHALTRAVVDQLLSGRFLIEFEHEAPWVGLRNYHHGAREGKNRELVLVMRKARAT